MLPARTVLNLENSPSSEQQSKMIFAITKASFVPRTCRGALLSFFLILSPALFGQHQIASSALANEFIAPASNQGELGIKRFQVAPGLKVDLWAAEPLLANP